MRTRWWVENGRIRSARRVRPRRLPILPGTVRADRAASPLAPSDARTVGGKVWRSTTGDGRFPPVGGQVPLSASGQGVGIGHVPSNNIDNWAGVRATTPLVAWGQKSDRCPIRHSPLPSPSHHRILIRSPRRFRNTNTWLENGSASSWLPARRSSAKVDETRRNPNPCPSQRPDHPRSAGATITGNSVSILNLIFSAAHIEP